MNLFDKLFFTALVVVVVLFFVCVFLALLSLLDGNTTAEKWCIVISIPVVAFFAFCLIYFIGVELLLDAVWGLNIHLPFSFL